MRPELAKFDDYFWGLTKNDFKLTSDLVKSFISAYWDDLKLPKDNNVEIHEFDLFIDQHGFEAQFLFQFGIWRLQSIFESLVKINFNFTKNCRGIMEIIHNLKSKQYEITKENELVYWGVRQNSLKHKISTYPITK